MDSDHSRVDVDHFILWKESNMTEVNPNPTPFATPVGNPADIEENKDARLWGMLCHLAALAGFIIPFGFIIGPLVVWLIKKNDFPFVDDQGKESLNFQITVILALIVSAILIIIVIGILLIPAVAITSLIFIIIASVKANSGIRYRYPVCIRFIK